MRSVSTIEPPYLYFQEVLEVTPQDMNVEKDADAASDHNLLVATIKLKHTHTHTKKHGNMGQRTKRTDEKKKKKKKKKKQKKKKHRKKGKKKKKNKKKKKKKKKT